MLRVIGVGGEPASGKSSLMREIIHRLGPNEPFERRTVKGVSFFKQLPILVLGVYEDGDIFGGTDRLSMAVMPDAIEMLKFYADPAMKLLVSILFEGDRLFCGKFIDECQRRAVDSAFYFLSAPEEALERRRADRPGRQSAAWVKGRVTKLANLLKTNPRIQRRNSSTPEDRSRLALEIIGRVRKV